MTRSAERAAENEATFRLANEVLAQKATELRLSEERMPYICECEDERCTEILQLMGAEYEAVRAHPRRFVLIPGHQQADDRVIREEPGFTVIEKGEQMSPFRPQADESISAPKGGGSRIPWRYPLTFTCEPKKRAQLAAHFPC